MTEIDFKKILAEYRDFVWPSIEKHLEEFVDFPEFCSVPKKHSHLIDFHKTMVSDYPKRKGKYLRPTLLLLTAQSMGLDRESAIYTAAAMQLSEEWILGHDDIEDDSLERRGEKAIHHIYGKELAINAGDALHILMWKSLFKNFISLGIEKGHQVVEEFARMLDRTVFGQTIDIKWNRENKKDLEDDDIFLMLESKTGYYTIAGPMRLGAILAGADQKQLEKIYEFGVLLGRSFQIIDDLLDLISDFDSLKKQKGNDIYEGKKTLILAHLLKHVSEKDKKKLEKILARNRHQKTEEEVAWVIKKMGEYGSLEYSKNKAVEFIGKAKQIFEKDLKFLKHEPYRSYLSAAIDFIANRTH